MAGEARLTGLQRSWSDFEAGHPRAASLLQALAVAAQLGLLVVVVRQFELESEGFQLLTAIALAGFLVHSQLPLALRLPFFCALSVVGFAAVLGVANTLLLFAIGGVLIGLCHLPVGFPWRVAAVTLAGTLLMLARGHWLPSPVSEAVWPILGSIFMFRLIVYLYDLRHRKQPLGPGWTFAYFFMLPNVCFPLFPVVDYARFHTTYYSEPAYRIYQRGIHWMFRGVFHLLLYRLVYQHVSLGPGDVATTADLVQYALGAFFLYLRVSGYFHLIVGMLLLFGFNLPETHHLYFLSSSFSDFWRRINIYWKDFMMKHFYYPAYFRLRRLGPTNALVLSTAVVFVGTWVLHSYQWFWLRGSVLFAAHDVLFWSILGVAMIANSLWEQRYGRKRSLGGHAPPPLARAAVVLRTAATFIVLCTLWMLWSSDSLEQWIDLWRVTDSLWLAATLAVAVVALAVLAQVLDRIADRRRAARPRAPEPRRAPAPWFFWGEAVPTTLAIAAFALLGWPFVSSRLGSEVASVVEKTQHPRLNARDEDLLERGYYEHLIAVNQQNVELWKLYSGKPRDWGSLLETAAWRQRDDFALGELVPETQMTWLGQPLRINRWGFRDEDYVLAKPPGTFRIAVLGSSHVFGQGVGDADVFDNHVERRLNAELGPGTPYEVLNFAAPNQNAVTGLQVLREKIAPFSPDLVLFFATTRDSDHTRHYLMKLPERGLDERQIPDAYLRNLLGELIDGNGATARTVFGRRVAPHVEDILVWAYAQSVEESRRVGATPVFVLLPLTIQRSSDIRAAQRDEAWIARTRATPGLATLDVSDVYDGREDDELAVAPWDNHANPLAHRLIADRLFDELAARTDLVPRGAPRLREEVAVQEPGGLVDAAPALR